MNSAFLCFLLILAVTKEGSSQCYTSSNCRGRIVAAYDQRDCCVNTNTGLSFMGGGTCSQCQVHGFVQKSYTVQEGHQLDVGFQLNVKGNIYHPIVIDGIIRAEAHGTATRADFDQILPVNASDGTIVTLFPPTDGMSMELSDSIVLTFTPVISNLAALMERHLGDYLRSTAVVHIRDSDVLKIFFEDCYYRVREGSTVSRQLRVHFYGPVQNAFSLTMRTVSIERAESMGLNNSFLGSANISTPHRATQGIDFSSSTRVVTVPATNKSYGVQTFKFPQFFSVVDDNINEPDQMFALVVTLGSDVPVGRGCFLLHSGTTECSGRSGATRIIIEDNDPMIIGFNHNMTNVSETPTYIDIGNIPVTIGISSMIPSEREYDINVFLDEQRSTANFDRHPSVPDAWFAPKFDPNSQFRHSFYQLQSGETSISDIIVIIHHDYTVETNECFVLELGFHHLRNAREPLVTCNYGTNATDYFCEHTICIMDDDKPFEVGFVQTSYSVMENAGSVEVCVQLTKPTIDILEETVVPYVVDDPTSVHIPNGSSLAVGETPNVHGTYSLAPGTDYAMQTTVFNHLKNRTISEWSRRVCYNQTIYDDTLVEGSEYFGLSLGIHKSSVHTTTKQMYDQAAILILDNDGIGKRSTHSVTDQAQVHAQQSAENIHTELRPRRQIPNGFYRCYSNLRCSGSTVPATSARDCCVGTDEGLSYFNGYSCDPCIVHGFTRASQNIEEGEVARVSFRLNVKGSTSLGVDLRGVISTSPAGTASISDYVPITPHYITNRREINIVVRDDFESLEYDDKVTVSFSPSNPNFGVGGEGSVQFLRNTTTLNIIDNDLLRINFNTGDCEYSRIMEGESSIEPNMTLEFQRNQEPFTIILRAVSISVAESLGVGNFSSHCSPQAMLGDDFSNQTINVTIPANSQTYTISKFFSVIDDNINEEDECFAIVAEVGPDVPDNTSCFQTLVDATQCHGRCGAAEIRIIDNDPMIIGFTQRTRTVSEESSESGSYQDILITLATLRLSEREYDLSVHLLDSMTNATVSNSYYRGSDVVFGYRSSPTDILKHDMTLVPLQSTMYSLVASIINDFQVESVECLSLRICANEINRFTCNEDGEGATSYFCEHTLCISDQDRPFEVAFVQTTYTVDEGVGTVNICINLTQPQVPILDETVSVFVVYYAASVPPNSNIATPHIPSVLGNVYSVPSGTDYLRQFIYILINEENTMVCYNQTIYDDVLMEESEYIGLSLAVSQLTTVTTLVKPMYDQASILILDNDSPVLIGFTMRTQTVSEAAVQPGQDIFRSNIPVALSRVSGESYMIIFHIIESMSQATVKPLATSNPNYDALFGVQSTPQDPIEFHAFLEFAASTIPSLTVFIRNDFVIEEKECFTIHIMLPPESILTCNNRTTRATNYFCDLTLCIEDDDVPYIVGFQQTAYTVDEGAGSVSVCVNMTQPQGVDFDDEDSISVYVVHNSSSFLIPNSASQATPNPPNTQGVYVPKQGSDFPQQTIQYNSISNQLITWKTRVVCYNQQIYDDDVVERDEYIGLSLGVNSNRFTSVLTQVEQGRDHASILIIDNDQL